MIKSRGYAIHHQIFLLLDDVSDGNADLPTEDSQLFSYHFYIQDYLTGIILLNFDLEKKSAEKAWQRKKFGI